jgi:predicted RNase H-like nuclease (RuvC/YqgF family)
MTKDEFLTDMITKGDVLVPAADLRILLQEVAELQRSNQELIRRLDMYESVIQNLKNKLDSLDLPKQYTRVSIYT